MESKALKEQKLVKRDRAIWYLFVFADFSLDEIAKKFKITKENVWDRLEKYDNNERGGHLKFKDLASQKTKK